MATIARTGRHAPRSKNGCSTCRIRKIKCDEQRPECSKCSQARIKCEWDRRLPPRRTVANHSVKHGESTVHESTLGSNTIKSHASNSPESVSGTDVESDVSSTGQPPAQSLALYDRNNTVTIPAIVSDHLVEMPNSLLLDPQDLKCFQYVPESIMVLRYGKPWRWSMLSFLHSKIAPRECGVMSAFIAVASMELRFRDLVQYQGSVITRTVLERAEMLRNSAAKHLNIAIKHLSSLLNRVSNTEPSADETETLFAMWFLILHCELYDPELIRASQIHPNGIRSFIADYMKDRSGIGTRKLPPASEQLLLFISYHDANLALGNLKGGKLCMDLLSIPKESPLAYDRIWEAARVCLPRLWGAEYPPEEILDDVENYRGLSFLQSCQKLKLSIWRLAVATGQGRAMSESRRRLWSKIEETGEEFTDLLTLAKYTRNSGGRRVMFTIYHGCLDYHAIKVLFSCLDYDDPSPSWLDTTLTDLLATAHKSLGEDPQQVYRTSWPLAVALLKVRDPIHRDWIQAQLRRARVLLSDVGLPARLLDGPSPPDNVFLEYSHDHLIEEIG